MQCHALRLQGSPLGGATREVQSSPSHTAGLVGTHALGLLVFATSCSWHRSQHGAGPRRRDAVVLTPARRGQHERRAGQSVVSGCVLTVPAPQFTWCLDACIRERFVDNKRARELQGFLDGVKKGQEQVLG